jgi:hypothetical protein
MYGRYTKELGEFAKEEARRLKALEKRRRKDDKRRNKELHKYNGPCMSRFSSVVGFIWQHTFAKLGEDWVFLALLGVIMAFLSFIMDMGIGMCNKGRRFVRFQVNFLLFFKINSFQTRFETNILDIFATKINKSTTVIFLFCDSACMRIRRSSCSQMYRLKQQKSDFVSGTTIGD